MLCRRRLLGRPLFPFFLQEITTTSAKQQQQQTRVRLSTMCDIKLPKKILTHAKADQVEQAHELISQLPSKCAAQQAYNQLIKAHARHVQDPIRQRKASSLVQEMKNKGLVPSSQTYFQLLLGGGGGGGGNSDVVLPWFYEFLRLEGTKGYKRTSIKLKRIIGALASRGGNSEQLKHMLTYTQQFIDVDKETWTIAIIGSTLSNKLEMAEELLNYARQQGKASVESYDVLIRAYLNKRQDLKSASQVFSNMSKDGLDATPSIYIAFIKTYIHEPVTKDDDCLLRIETVRRLWQAMMISATSIEEEEEGTSIEKNKTDMTTQTTTTTKHSKKRRSNNDIPIPLIAQIIEYYRCHGALSDAEQVYLDTTKKLKIQLNRHCVGEMNKLIISFVKRKGGQIPSVLSLYYDLLGLGHKPSMGVMQEIIKLLCQKGQKETAYQLIQITTETTLNEHNYTLDTSALEKLIQETKHLK